MGGCDECSLSERDREQAGKGDAAEQHVEQHELSPDCVDGRGAGEQHANHRAGEEDKPGRLGRVDQRDQAGAQAATKDGS
jgi:hypothetical protein